MLDMGVEMSNPIPNADYPNYPVRSLTVFRSFGSVDPPEGTVTSYDDNI